MHEASPFLGMAVQDLPLLVIGLAGLVEQLLGHLELAHVVEECSPAQPRLTRLVQLQLVGDEVGEDADALRVAAGAPVVNAECEDQLDH